MIIDEVKVYTFKELESRLRRVPLVGNRNIKLYSEATIERPALMKPNDLRIAQHYIMNPILHAIVNINKQLLAKGISFMDMEGFISFNTEEDPTEWTDLLPPVVEWDQASNGWLICDGAHRVSVAHLAGRNIKVVRISDIDEKYPYYAYANYNGWKDVKQVDTPPEVKKNYRYPDSYKDYFRDFNAPFTNVTKKR